MLVFGSLYGREDGGHNGDGFVKKPIISAMQDDSVP